MARVRCITEMGMGVDVHGKDATKAAKRAVSDAIRHSSLGFFRMVGKTPRHVRRRHHRRAGSRYGRHRGGREGAALRHGDRVTAVKGGLEIPAESGGDSIIIANAAVIVSLDDGKGG